MNHEAVERFRAQERSGYIGKNYSGWAHLSVTTFGSMALMALLAWPLHHVRPLEWLVIPLAMVIANVAEYVGHRWPMHKPMKGFMRAVYDWHALKHHKFFTETTMEITSVRDLKVVLFPPFIVAGFLGGVGLPTGVLIGLLWSANAGFLFGVTAVAYFLVYEYLHLGFHLPEPILGRMKWLQRMGASHTRHHKLAIMAKAHFNVAFPWTDIVLRTRESDVVRRVGTGTVETRATR